MMKAVMYHYVRPFDKAYPYFKNLHFDDFKLQLDYFKKNFGFISKKSFKECLIKGKPTKGIILTFDDGFSCHYNYVFKELKKRDLWGIFYVPTKPYVKKTILDVHKVHLLLGKFKSFELFETLNEIADKTFFDQKKIEEFKKFTYLTQKNDSYTLYVKRALNYFIGYEHRSKIIEKLMNIYFPNRLELEDNFYMTKAQIVEMQKEGMVIGSHTVDHPVMSRLNFKKQDEQIKNSFYHLKQIVESFPIKTYCHPYGGFHSFNNLTEEILSKYETDFSFNVESRDIDENDLSHRKQCLPRYDCNEFKYGKIRKRA